MIKESRVEYLREQALQILSRDFVLDAVRQEHLVSLAHNAQWQELKEALRMLRAEQRIWGGGESLTIYPPDMIWLELLQHVDDLLYGTDPAE